MEINKTRKVNNQQVNIGGGYQRFGAKPPYLWPNLVQDWLSADVCAKRG